MEQIKFVEDVMKWSVTEKAKVMLVRNIIAGKLQLNDPELVEHFKSSLAQSIPQSNPEPKLEPKPEPKSEKLYECGGTVTNMVLFNNCIWFSMKGECKIYIIGMSGKLVHTLTTSREVVHIAAGKDFIFHSDVKNRIVCWRKNYSWETSIEYPADKYNITSLFIDDEDKIYVGNESGRVYVYDLFSGGITPTLLTRTLPNAITHIRKFDNILVMASNNYFTLYSLETYSSIEGNNTYGRIISVIDTNKIISVYTTEGCFSYKYDGAGVGKEIINARYVSTANKIGAVFHQNHILISSTDGLVTDIFDGKTIVNHTPGNSNIIMFVHNNKLYSTGSDHRIQVTDL